MFLEKTFTMSTIPLINANGEIEDYTLVDECYFNHLNQFKWHKSKDGHVRGIVNGTNWRMCDYIMNVLVPNEQKPKENQLLSR